ncbi:hypothetical protein ACNKHQ_01085 [Shigella flexneri]
MGPHSIYYKEDEPIKELEGALLAQGFQKFLLANGQRADLLKFMSTIRVYCGVPFLTGTNTASISVVRFIRLNEYLPLYAFINNHSTMSVSARDMRMALWFLNLQATGPTIG